MDTPWQRVAQPRAYCLCSRSGRPPAERCRDIVPGNNRHIRAAQVRCGALHCKPVSGATDLVQPRALIIRDAVNCNPRTKNKQCFVAALINNEILQTRGSRLCCCVTLGWFLRNKMRRSYETPLQGGSGLDQ